MSSCRGVSAFGSFFVVFCSVIKPYIAMVRCKNKGFSPEKLVEQQVLAWAFENRWSLHVFDSKAIRRGDRMQSNPGIPVGCPDLLGNCPCGFAAYIELKKHNADGVCRISQRNFLLQKIDSNAFACVVDSPEKIEQLYEKWVALREISWNVARDLLRKALPTKVIVNGKVISVAD